MRSRDSPLTTQTLIFVVFILLITYVYFLKITTFLWIILILHPGPSSLLLETVTKKIWGPRGREPTYGPGTKCREKKYPCLVVHFVIAYNEEFNMKM